MFKDGKSCVMSFLHDWRDDMYSGYSTKNFPVVARCPIRTRIHEKPNANRDDSPYLHKEAFRLQNKEERYLTLVTMIPLAILLLPAFALIVYLILNPDAFMVLTAP